MDLAAPVTIATITILVIVYIIAQVLLDFNIYSKDTGFLSPNTFFIGTLIALYFTAIHVGLVKQREYSNYLLSSSLFFVFYFLFTLNLTIRVEYYVNAARLPITAGASWLFLALAILLILFAYDKCDSTRVILLIPIIWVLYLFYNWTMIH